MGRRKRRRSGESARATDSLLGAIFHNWSKEESEGEKNCKMMGGTREIRECARERWLRERGSESQGGGRLRGSVCVYV